MSNFVNYYAAQFVTENGCKYMLLREKTIFITN